MRSYADLRDDRIAEINVQIDDILSFFGAIALIDNQRRLRTLELLEATVRLCIHAEMKLKHLCRAPRPIDLAPEVQPIVQTPDHSTFPSGHATEAFAVATVLHRLMTGAGPKAGIGKDADGLQTHRAQVFRLANRIAANRTVAGVHFPVDTAAGALLGCIIGDMVYGLGTEQKPKQARAFTAVVGDGGALPAQFAGAHDFDLTWLEAALPDDRKSVKPVAQGTILQEFWRMAKTEWPE
jgi:PAP2 superfamily